MRDDIGRPELEAPAVGTGAGAGRRRGPEGLGPDRARPEPRWSRDGLCLLPAAGGGRDRGLSPEPIH